MVECYVLELMDEPAEMVSVRAERLFEWIEVAAEKAFEVEWEIGMTRKVGQVREKGVLELPFSGARD